MPRHPVFTDELIDAALSDEVVLPPSDRPMRWFHQGWLDALTRSPTWSPYVVGLPAAGTLAWAGPFSAGAAALGVLTWTFVEYALHRFIFHFPPTTDIRKVVTFVLHRHHHRDPGATDRLAATPAQAAGLLVPLAAVAHQVDPGHWTAFSFGLVAAWIAYEALHYSHHHGSSSILGPLRAHHLRHHHADPARGFGISSPLWDWLLRSDGGQRTRNEQA